MPPGIHEILDYGANMMKLANQVVPPETTGFLLSVMKKYLLNKISYEEAKNIFLTHFRSSRPIENLKEINCSVLGDCDDYRTSILEEPIKSGDFLTYEDKYMGGTKTERGMQASQKRIPADLPQEITDRIRHLAGETFRVLSCHGVSRVDFMVDANTNDVYVNEINTIPGSLSFYLWEATGTSFDKLMDELVALALKRKREQGLKTTNFDHNIFNLTGKGGTKFGTKTKQ